MLEGLLISEGICILYVSASERYTQGVIGGEYVPNAGTGRLREFGIAIDWEWERNIGGWEGRNIEYTR